MVFDNLTRRKHNENIVRRNAEKVNYLICMNRTSKEVIKHYKLHETEEKIEIRGGP